MSSKPHAAAHDAPQLFRSGHAAQAERMAAEAERLQQRSAQMKRAAASVSQAPAVGQSQVRCSGSIELLLHEALFVELATACH